MAPEEPLDARAVEEVLEALAHAGVGRDRINFGGPEELSVYVAGTDRTLTFRLWPGENQWLWEEWEPSSDGCHAVGDDGWETHPEGMVARVIEFLKETP
jgi:hypothetical protein